MAIYHLSIKIISRGKGESAVAAAAYRSGEKIINDYDSIIHDYTRKRGVVHTEILLPEHAPLEFADRTTLWNAVEKIEKNKNSQLAREIEIAMPNELSSIQQIELAHEYCRKFFVSAGMCADVCIHDKEDGNPHAHIMLTMRPFEQDGSWAAKSKKEYMLDENGERIQLKSGEYKSRKVDVMDWNDHAKAEEWRQGWAEMCNAHLEQSSMVERVDHRSYERQGNEQIPTIHVGIAACQMERRGIASDRGNTNRQIQLDNNMLRQLRARINKLKSRLEELLAEEKSLSIHSHPIPSNTLVDALVGMFERPEERTRYQKVANLKTVSKAIAFLQQHGINDLSRLRDRVDEMHVSLRVVTNSLKKVERRMKTLDEHITNADNYAQHRALYAEYKKQKPSKQSAFYDHHRAEIVLYEAADRYLHQVMNGHTTIPIKAWKAELASLGAKKVELYTEHVRQGNEVREVEVIVNQVERMMRGNEPIDRTHKDKSEEIH